MSKCKCKREELVEKSKSLSKAVEYADQMVEILANEEHRMKIENLKLEAMRLACKEVVDQISEATKKLAKEVKELKESE